MLRLASILLLVACGSRPSTDTVRPAASDGCPVPVGDRAQYTLAASDSIAEPQTCATNGPDEAFIRVTGHGTRPFSIASPGHETGCVVATAECETVDLGAFLRAVGAKLTNRGIGPVSTVGLGRCGHGAANTAPWQDRHMSVTIYDWRYANDTVTILDAELRGWNVGQSYEIAVQHILCGHAEGR